MNYLVVGYFTASTFYELEAKRLIASLMRFQIPYYIAPIENQGDWYKNTQYKPTFLKAMLEKFKPASLVYVDVDAEFCRPPDLFDELVARSDVNVAVHLLDHKKRGRSAGFEMLSGTIFLKNNSIVEGILDKWIEICREGGNLWDQVALSRVLREIPYHVLPEEYCTIFDYMQDVKEPVIKHYQASRRVPDKGNNNPLPKYDAEPVKKEEKQELLSKAKRVPKGSLTRYHIQRRWRNLLN